MAAVIFQLLHLFLILEVGYWAKAAAEDRRGDAQESAEHRSPVRGSASRVSAVSASMFRLYEQYSKEPHRQRDANTVRSFKAVPGVSETGEWFQFNLSSIQDSEHILSASFHFLHKRPRHQRPSVSCRPRNPSCTFQRQQQPPSLALLFHGASRGSAPTPLLGNATVAPFKRGLWQAMDITSVVEQARALNEFLIHVEFDSGSPPSHEGLSSSNLPYILAYADDQAIDDPNSVALSLQRYSPFPLGEDPARSRDAPAPPLLSASRARRELPRFPAGQIQTNDLPEVHFNTLKNHELWQSTYFPPKAKAVVRHGRKQGLEGGGSPGKPQVLSFDERTMKKARRRQWNEPRVCARRYLRVDFADIGWNEWVVAPKAFDAYYCSGTCGFPIPRVVRPSNHATIQSIVRAVGIVPGVPEPCCVPDQMSPLPVLFLDPNRNIVLKVYPAMSVDTCTCR